MSAVTPPNKRDEARPLRTIEDPAAGQTGRAAPQRAAELLTRHVTLPVYLLAIAVLALLAMLAALVFTGGDEQAGSSANLYVGPALVAGEPGGFWENIDGENVTTSVTAGVAGDALAVELGEGREFFSVLEHNFAEPTPFAGTRWLFLEFRGTGDGAAYTLLLDSNAEREDSAVYNFVDTSDGWRVLSFDLLTPGEGDAPAAGGAAPLVKLRLTTDKENAGSFAVGRLSTSQPQG
jgi:hypothetical protein